VAVGIQSTHPETLKNIQRAFDLEAATGTSVSSSGIRTSCSTSSSSSACPATTTRPSSGAWTGRFPSPAAPAHALRPGPASELGPGVHEGALRPDGGPEGLVRSNATFSPDDMMRASWLFAAYCYLRNTSGFKEKLEALLQRPGKRPSEVSRKSGCAWWRPASSQGARHRAGRPQAEKDTSARSGPSAGSSFRSWGPAVWRRRRGGSRGVRHDHICRQRRQLCPDRPDETASGTSLFNGKSG